MCFEEQAHGNCSEEYLAFIRNFYLCFPIKLPSVKETFMIIAILGYLFLVIFALTALLTLLSLPNWIVIPDDYRKALFRMLLLEVAGAVIILFTNSYLKKEALYNPKDSPEWVALNLEDGSLFQPKIAMRNPDSILVLGADTRKALDRLQSKLLYGELMGGGFTVKNSKKQALGYISKSELENSKLFNAIRSEKGEISASDDYRLVKFFKTTHGNWERRGEFLYPSPYTIKILDEDGKTTYRIYDSRENTVVFNSTTSSKQLFDVDNRIIHFYQYEKEFYLFRITEANLTSRNGSYVHVLQIKLKPVVLIPDN